MKRASHYLDPRDHAARKTLQTSQKEVDNHQPETERVIDQLQQEGVTTERPKTRGECPTKRPCPFVSCQYHLYLDVTDHGSIKYNFHGRAPWELNESCALDIAEEHPDGKPLSHIGKHFGLTRERIRQIEVAALKKIRKEYDLDDLQNLLRPSDDKEKLQSWDDHLT